MLHNIQRERERSWRFQIFINKRTSGVQNINSHNWKGTFKSIFIARGRNDTTPMATRSITVITTGKWRLNPRKRIWFPLGWFFFKISPETPVERWFYRFLWNWTQAHKTLSQLEVLFYCHVNSCAANFNRIYTASAACYRYFRSPSSALVLFLYAI
jgi:hypothetical protein